MRELCAGKKYSDVRPLFSRFPPLPNGRKAAERVGRERKGGGRRKRNRHGPLLLITIALFCRRETVRTLFSRFRILLIRNGKGWEERGGGGATEGRGVLHPSAKNEKKNAEITLTFTLVQQEECIFSVRKQETVIKCNRDTGGPEIEGGKIFQRL